MFKPMSSLVVLSSLLLATGLPQMASAGYIDSQDKMTQYEDKHAAEKDKEKGNKKDKASNPLLTENPLYDLDTSYNWAQTIKGKIHELQPLKIVQGGSYELIVKDLTEGNALRSYGASLTYNGEELAEVFGTGQMVFKAEAGEYSLDIFAKSWSGHAGKLSVALKPYSEMHTKPVPLPAALWLFGSGLVFLLRGRRSQTLQTA